MSANNHGHLGQMYENALDKQKLKYSNEASLLKIFVCFGVNHGVLRISMRFLVVQFMI